MKEMSEAKITGQDPVYPHFKWVLFEDRGYYLNAETGDVTTFVFSRGSHVLRKVRSARILKAVRAVLK